ncbi:rhomboid family intramembrane serine protease [Parapedobacter koreensis]|uniref:Membrane associated serine protease, rhomboid family n=1 Tax=Parapedobacter koreensis TaxID=332977 RepID=A0A1H7Q5B5_9SPHI|nr:rhomboid family intramembrane serine protease [Parapedobacter koreensis]SEL43351.1 Membrane associated serine protease, rhomboid family [Parapedobacter koreensis]
MKRSWIGGLWDKAFRSGSPLYLFIAINILVFVGINMLSLITALRFTDIPLSGYLMSWLQLPASITAWLYKPWTIATYMFTQQGLFHVLFNMLWLFWLGIIFLDFLKKRQFTFVYLAGGLAGGLLYLLAFNLIPIFKAEAFRTVMIGSSASVSAIVFATATLLPDYTIRMLFFGNVRLKYLALAFIAIDVLAIGGFNAGGSIAHIGGALFGFVYIKRLQNGQDWSRILGVERKKRKLRVVRNDAPPYEEPLVPNQEVIDRILDKISQSGYESLTKAEKEALFKASKQGQNEY